MAVARASPALIGAAFFVISACTSDSAAVADTTAGAETGAVSSRSGSEWVAVADLGSSSSPVVSDAPLQTKLALWMELMQPKPAVRFDEAAAFVQENPDWPAQTVLRRRVEELMPEFLPAELMLDWFAARPPVSSVGKLRHAEALLRTGQQDRAHEILRRLWAVDGLPDDLEEPFLERYGNLITRQDDLVRLGRLLWNRYGQARRQAQRLGTDYVLLADARLALAGGRADAAKALARVPGSLRDDPGLLFDRAVWHQRRDEVEQVVMLLDRAESGLRADRWWPVRHWAARKALDGGDATTAYRLASRHGLTEGANLAEAEWLAGWIALRFLHDPNRAWNHFARFSAVVSTPVSQARGAYWSGRAAEAMGNRALARQQYELGSQDATTFYGQLSAARIGKPLLPEIETAPQPTAADRAAFERRELVRAVILLSDMGERRWVDLFLAQLGQDAATPVEGRLVAQLAMDADRRGQAVAIARMLRTRGIILPNHLFPVVPVEPVATEDPALVLAIIRQESGFNPEAVSRAGALGLMQLMPGTAREVAAKLGIGYRHASLTAEPGYNLLLGQTYLNHLLDRFDGSVLLATAGYNAGPGNVDRWLERYGDPRNDHRVDPIDWIERIPLAETRNYVQRVFEALHVYRQRLDPALPLIALSPELGVSVAASR